ncbi:hypothetical protein FIBSPDRAFT_874198 [Athelia psychrophila]|uniref:Uncharacterized protein n=1 Tax=Athelia psychrophila TaxID=1759441 RepID=A0A165XPG6_9AGAM|nr:hypothetical protein FIBSPDRAFT_874198 [Fibularhizoctonia sp. CBS 109695]
MNEATGINAESTTGRGERTSASMGAGVAGGTPTTPPPPPGSAARSGSGRIKEGIVSVQRTDLPFPCDITIQTITLCCFCILLATQNTILVVA